MRDRYAQRMMEMGEHVCSRLGKKTAERQTGPVSSLPCWKAWRQAGEQMVQEEEPEPVDEAGVLEFPPQAARANTMARARSRASNFLTLFIA